MSACNAAVVFASQAAVVLAPHGPATPRDVTPFVKGDVRRRASAFGTIRGSPNRSPSGANNCSTAASGGKLSSPPHALTRSPPLSAPPRKALATAPASPPLSAPPRTALATDEIYRAQYRDLAEAEVAVAESERGEHEQHNDAVDPTALRRAGEASMAPAAARSDRSLGKSPAPAAQRSSRDEEKLELLALGMLPPFDGRRRPAAGPRSDRPGTRLRLPPLPVNALPPMTDTSRSGSTSSQAQSAFASPSLLMWTPNATQRCPGMPHGQLDHACGADLVRRASAACASGYVPLTSLREYDSHAYNTDYSA